MTAHEEKRPPVHIKPLPMPDDLASQAQLQVDRLNNESDDIVEAQRKVPCLYLII